MVGLMGTLAVEKFGYGKHEKDLPDSIRGSHQADLVNRPRVERKRWAGMCPRGRPSC